jgi:excisionase family DNA binding protein
VTLTDETKGCEMQTKFTLLTVNDIAERLLLSEQHARRLCREKRLPAFRLGRDYRIDEADLNSYVESLKPAREAV